MKFLDKIQKISFPILSEVGTFMVGIGAVVAAFQTNEVLNKVVKIDEIIQKIDSIEGALKLIRSEIQEKRVKKVTNEVEAIFKSGKKSSISDKFLRDRIKTAEMGIDLEHDYESMVRRPVGGRLPDEIVLSLVEVLKNTKTPEERARLIQQAYKPYMNGEFIEPENLFPQFKLKK
jgi:hypothetical protein